MPTTSTMERDGPVGAPSQAQLVLPSPEGPSRPPAVWTGESFRIGSRTTRVLAYDVGDSGWSDDLTSLHEDATGSQHFMDVASRAHALGEVRRSIRRPRSTVLEIGVSSGFLLDELVEALPDHFVMGADYTPQTLNALAPRLPNVPLIQFDLTRCPLPDESVDVAVLLNVLEHIRDDRAAVAHIFRILRPGGTAVIEVPAGSSLLDVYDRVLMHFRRYDMPQLVGLHREAGFIVERRSHLGFLLYPAFHLSKQLNKRRYPPGTKVDEAKIVARMIASTGNSGPLMHRVMRIEQRLRDRLYLPLGIRCLVTCRKPQQPPAASR